METYGLGKRDAWLARARAMEEHGDAVMSLTALRLGILHGTTTRNR